MRDFDVLDCQINQRVASMPKCFFSLLPARCKIMSTISTVEILPLNPGESGKICSERPSFRHAPGEDIPVCGAVQECLSVAIHGDGASVFG